MSIVQTYAIVIFWDYTFLLWKSQQWLSWARKSLQHLWPQRVVIWTIKKSNFLSYVTGFIEYGFECICKFKYWHFDRIWRLLNQIFSITFFWRDAMVDGGSKNIQVVHKKETLISSQERHSYHNFSRIETNRCCSCLLHSSTGTMELKKRWLVTSPWATARPFLPKVEKKRDSVNYLHLAKFISPQYRWD